MVKSGIRANDLVMPYCVGEERRRNEKVNQYGTVWPFVMGYAILALDKMGEKGLAREIFYRWSRVDGFHEWIDPATGLGRGAKRQMWNGPSYLRAGKQLGRF